MTQLLRSFKCRQRLQQVFYDAQVHGDISFTEVFIVPVNHLNNELKEKVTDCDRTRTTDMKFRVFKCRSKKGMLRTLE